MQLVQLNFQLLPFFLSFANSFRLPSFRHGFHSGGFQGKFQFPFLLSSFSLPSSFPSLLLPFLLYFSLPFLFYFSLSFLLYFSLPFFLSLICFISLPLGMAFISADFKVSFNFFPSSFPSYFLLICFISLPLGRASLDELRNFKFDMKKVWPKLK